MKPIKGPGLTGNVLEIKDYNQSDTIGINPNLRAHCPMSLRLVLLQYLLSSPTIKLKMNNDSTLLQVTMAYCQNPFYAESLIIICLQNDFQGSMFYTSSLLLWPIRVLF